MKNLMFLIGVFASVNLMATSLISQSEKWGGEGISVIVYSDQSAGISFDCARGNVPAGRWQPNQSRINAVGTFTKEMGGQRPIPGEEPRSEKAVYAANVDVSKGTMTLSMKIKSGKTTYKLVKGSEGSLRRCM